MKRSLLIIMLIATIFVGLSGETIFVNSSHKNGVNLIESNSSQTIIEMTLGNFNRDEVMIDGEVFNHVRLEKEAETYEKGAPEVPTVTRSIIIDGSSKPVIQLIDSAYVDFKMTVAPSKGIIYRDVDPETVPYEFGDVYNEDTFYPGEISTLGSAYIMRNHRGVAVRFNPFQYNPTTEVLRVYTSIKVSVTNSSEAGENVLTRSVKSVSAFEQLYKNHFLNYETERYEPLEDKGSILVIAPQNYHEVMQQYVDWKNQKGIKTEMVDVATIGNTATSIKNYIQTYYDTHDDFAFVQIAGDAAQVATLTSGGGGADPMYALVDGNDAYPDIFIGRFSAETTDELLTQVERTINYERDLNSSSTFLNKAMGIASSEGGGSQGDNGESDIQHMNIIRDNLLAYNYETVDQIYAPSASSSAVANSLDNEGRGFINYVGHGSNTAWSTTGFSNSHVNNLTNTGKLPFIVTVACVNGNFVNRTCFAEAWMRATHNGSPTGSVAIYASTINQSWNAPMRGQDAIVDLITAEESSVLGALLFSGSCDMIDAYGTNGSDMFKTWIIFGDASLEIRTDTPEELTLNHTGILFIGTDSYSVSTGEEDMLVAVSYNGELLGSGYTDATGSVNVSLNDMPLNPVDLTLTVTGFNKVTKVEPITLTPAEGSFVIIDEIPTNTTHIGYSGNFSFNIKNVGVESSSDLTITLASTEPGIVIQDNQVTVENIAADEVVILPEDAFQITVPVNVPDRHMIPFTVNITADGGANNWNYPISLMNKAPKIILADVVASEVIGNGNNRMDAGETFLLTVPVTNIGGYQADLVNFAISYPLGLVIANDNNIQIENIMATEEDEVSFEIILSSQIPAGTELEFQITAHYGSFSETVDYSTSVGLAVEDFESQTLNNFAWTTSDNYTFSQHAYEGNYSLKSATISNNSSTSIQVEFESATAGEFSFWMHVSTEPSYDQVKFYINNTMMINQSGDTGWVNYAYAVSAGTNVYKWTYTKDYMWSANDDCFYLDYVSFPGGDEDISGTPVIVVESTDLDFGPVDVNQRGELTTTISNTGTEVGIAQLTLSDPFYILGANNELLSTMSFALEEDEELEYTLVFAPSRVQEYNAQAMIVTDDPEQNEIIINLTGVALVLSNDDNAIVPAITSLKGNYPNPFNPETNISFGMKNAGNVEITVYNLLGQKVKTLLKEFKPAGNHSVVWNGKDDNGRSVSSGVYFYRMSTEGYSKTSKMILMK